MCTLSDAYIVIILPIVMKKFSTYFFFISSLKSKRFKNTIGDSLFFAIMRRHEEVQSADSSWSWKRIVLSYFPICRYKLPVLSSFSCFTNNRYHSFLLYKPEELQRTNLSHKLLCLLFAMLQSIHLYRFQHHIQHLVEFY